MCVHWPIAVSHGSLDYLYSNLVFESRLPIPQFSGSHFNSGICVNLSVFKKVVNL